MKVWSPGWPNPFYRADDPWEPWQCFCDSCGARVSEYDYPVGTSYHLCRDCDGTEDYTDREESEEMCAPFPRPGAARSRSQYRLVPGCGLNRRAAT
jgi:hypothetical protein